ncbi:MAG: tetratricopeptide repeat protein [Ferruginibacter sp.]
MKKSICVSLSIVAFLFSIAQDPVALYKQGNEKANEGNYEEAIVLFTKTIEVQPENYYAWYNRGISKSRMNQYEEALIDFEQVVRLNPEYKKGYLNRGIARKHLTDYDAAMADYSMSIALDPEYNEAYFNKGLLFELLGNKDSACINFANAKEKGSKLVEQKIERCNDTSARLPSYFAILRLSKKADNNKYGYTQEDPIKVGYGPNGGPANQQAYLELLRDAQGKPIKYERLGSCCMYDSPGSILGKGMLDKYQVIYRNEKNEEVKTVLYISFDDYEELKIPVGFKTVGQK